MRSNLIGHTIFLTSEKYRVTNQKHGTIFFTSKKIRIAFSRLWGSHAKELRVNVCNILCFPRIMASSFADINSVEQFIEDQENENTRKKTQQSITLLKEFLTRRNDSRLLPEELKSMHISLNLSLRLERKTAAMNPTRLATYVLWWPVFNGILRGRITEQIQHYERRRVWTGTQIKTKGSHTERKRKQT